MKVTAIIFAMLVVYASAATQDYKLLFDSLPSFGGTGETAVDAYSKFVVFATNNENNKLFEPGMIWTAAEQPLIDFATTDDVTLADDLVTYIEGLDGGATWTATSYPALIRSPSSVEVTYTVDDQFPYVGMMVRVGTSPDFFVATQPQRIHDGTNFEEVVKAPLYGWDSGKYIENTIGAATYTEYPDEPPVPDQDTLYKPQPVVMSVTPPFAADDNVMAVGTVNFYAPTYLPQVTGVSPAEAAHGDVIRIMADNIGGANFVGTRSVTVNGVDCPIYEQDGVQTVGTFYIDCQTPSGTTLDKNVDIVVTVNGAQSQGGNAVFSYVEPDTDAGCADCYDETYGGLAPWLKYSLFAVGGLAFVAIIVVVVVVIKKKKGGSSTDERY